MASILTLGENILYLFIVIRFSSLKTIVALLPDNYAAPGWGFAHVIMNPE